MFRTFTVLFFAFLCKISYCFDEDDFVFLHRKLFAGPTQTTAVNHTLNGMHEAKNATNSHNKDDESAASKAGTEAAVLIIVAIVLLSIIGMIVYFLRKFEQLNRSVPTYRYSSLKTEINGMYGPDDKTESQALVNVSTEEEDYDDDDEDDSVSPPTLMVRSQQTVTSSNKISNGTAAISNSSGLKSKISKSNTTLDSDDELLQ